jgi:hypothetical protein
MRLVRRITVLSLAVGLGLTLVSTAEATAGHGTGSRHSHVGPARHADGMTGGQLLAQEWRKGYETSAGTPEPPCLYLGRTGKVLLAGRVDRVCTVQHGYPVMYFFGSDCDTVSPPPYFAVSPRAQRMCAKAADQALIKSMYLKVDDGPTTRITRPRFELYTRQQHVQIPPDNGQGVPAGPATFTTHVWAAFAQHLCLGLHTTTFTIDFVDGSTDVTPRTIRVVH